MRDDFSANVRKHLERRVASVCSKPGCGRITAGPHSSNPSQSVSVGEAGHITSAAPKGPRHDKSLTSAQRASASNGIWLCSACHGIVDSDHAPFSAETLREWKAGAEARAREALEFARERDEMPALVAMLHRSMELVPDRSLERSMPLLMRSVHEVIADLRGSFVRLDAIDHRLAVAAQVKARDELWAHADAVPNAEFAYYVPSVNYISPLTTTTLPHRVDCFRS